MSDEFENWSPFMAGRYWTFEKVMDALRANPDPVEPYGWTDFLFDSLSNKAVEDRVAMATMILDHGADPSVISRDGDRINCLHVLFTSGSRVHDPALEAPLLERLLDGGASMTLRSPRFGTPFEMMTKVVAAEELLYSFYDVVFARPDIDMGVVIDPPTGKTLAQKLLSPLRRGRGRMECARRAQDYIKKHGLQEAAGVSDEDLERTLNE